MKDNVDNTNLYIFFWQNAELRHTVPLRYFFSSAALNVFLVLLLFTYAGETMNRITPFLRTLRQASTFPRPPPANLNSQKGVEQFIDIGTSAGARRNGRAWRTSELRLKSFDDLHKLWFVLLKERNILLSEKAWCKTNERYWQNGHSNLGKVKQSMARLKTVISERTRALKEKRKRSKGLAEALEGSTTDVN